MPRKRTPKRAAPNFDDLIAKSHAVAHLNVHWTREGYERTRAQAWRRRDGSYTVRLVWRRRGALVSAVTCTLEGLLLA